MTASADLPVPPGLPGLPGGPVTRWLETTLGDAGPGDSLAGLRSGP